MVELPVGNWGIRGTWHGKAVSSNFSDYRLVIVSCPTCALDSSISRYTIGEDGAVSPAFSCPYACGCRKEIKLLGYAEFLKQTAPPSTPPPSS